ncbi:MAG TPA: VWA domain-containing protein [Planctomycetota bacterium]|nr:VWA domain-containing protein [Planctomycetota bacterium]
MGKRSKDRRREPRPSPVRERGPSLPLDAFEVGFHKVWKRWRGRSESRARRALGVASDQLATWQPLVLALETVAGTFAGRRVIVRPAERSGGCQAGVLLIPQSIAIAPDLAANRDFYFVRAALAGACLADLRFPGAQAEESEILGHGLRVASGLAREHAGFRERVGRAAQWEIATRPDLSAIRTSLDPNHWALERLRQIALRWVADPAFPSLPLPAPFDVTPLAQRVPNTTGRRGWLPKGWFSGASSKPPLEPSLLFGGPLTPSDFAAALAASESTESPQPDSDVEERMGRAREHAQVIALPEDPAKEDMPSHSFEKVDYADEYDGGFRRLDGANDMEEQGDSLDEVDLRTMIRGGPPVETVYAAEMATPPDIPDVYQVLSGEQAVLYDEWDQANQRYLRDWVAVYPTSILTRDPAFGHKLRQSMGPTIRRAIALLEARRTERLLRNRQLDGSEVDVDSLIDEYAQRRRGGSPPGRVYLHLPRLERDVATCVLVDLSFSADSWIQDRRVLDVELAATCLLGSVADHFGESLAVLAYASNTRNCCRSLTVKDWHEPWSTANARLGILKPQGYTRIGPALRHATHVLHQSSARKRHLIVITDGKPTDFDRYEGSHGIHDVACAVREARRAEIAVHAIGLDPRAASNLPSMFGPGSWSLLRHLGELPEVLLAAYG